ncbi:hypothetical protein EDD16DRAFT_1714562 [Pisolithus croceorrhizus]|nr:hypothetical protein EDD16DRAFT_1714562 [Pisolithus croceorrhizus]
MDLSESAPHLTAIARPRSISLFSEFSVQFENSYPSAPPVHAMSEHRSPPTTEPFLSRLATYKLAACANKPSQVDAAAAAKGGWINDRKDWLVCGICNVSWVLAGRDVMIKETSRKRSAHFAANALVKKQRVYFVAMDTKGCPCKMRQCDASGYRVSLESSNLTARDLRTTAVALDPVAPKIAINHPLAPSQLSSLRLARSTASVPTLTSGDPAAMQVNECATPNPALSSSHDRRFTLSMLASHWGSFAASASVLTTPALSRASSVSCRSASRIQLRASPALLRRANDPIPNSEEV